MMQASFCKPTRPVEILGFFQNHGDLTDPPDAAVARSICLGLWSPWVWGCNQHSLVVFSKITSSPPKRILPTLHTVGWKKSWEQLHKENIWYSYPVLPWGFHGDFFHQESASMISISRSQNGTFSQRRWWSPSPWKRQTYSNLTQPHKKWRQFIHQRKPRTSKMTLKFSLVKFFETHYLIDSA